MVKVFSALVLGDYLLDAYMTGKVRRISPEAPVPVMEVLAQEERAGGAGNVVLNLLALGATVFAVGRVGPDAEGERLKNHLRTADAQGLFTEQNYRTPVKTRLIAASQQLLRIDCERIQEISTDLEEKVIEKLKTLIPQVQIVAISDYGKGFLTKRIVQSAIAIAKSSGIRSIVDPKGTDFSKYRGASLLKPNLSEALAAAGTADLEEAAQKLQPYAETLLITRSEAGISVFEKGNRSDFPVRCHEVKDVTGAGDTVLSVLCMAIAHGFNISMAAQLANTAAGIAIERVGCVQVTLSEIAERFLEAKIFGEQHLFALEQVFQQKRLALLSLERGQAMTHALYRTICEMAADQELMVHVDLEEKDPFVQLLSSLKEVKSIIVGKKMLQRLREKADVRIYQEGR